MKFSSGIGILAILWFFGTQVPVHAQQERKGEKPEAAHDKASPMPREPRTQKQQVAGHQKRSKLQQPRLVGEQAEPQHTQEQARAWQQQRGWLQQGGWPAHELWQEHRAQRWSSDHRTWTQRGGYGGSSIPGDRFGLSFGEQHLFRIETRPVMYLGYPRFEYGGVSFLLVDPWPEYWPDNWYDVNDVYISYDDGYYLHNRGYPQVNLAIAVAL